MGEIFTIKGSVLLLHTKVKQTRWLRLVYAKANVIKIRLYITANQRNEQVSFSLLRTFISAVSLKTDLISMMAESINRSNLHFGERSAGG
jgi:hypothetical protein